LMPGGGMEKTFFVQCMRGNPAYGKNDFHDNADGTVTDRATGLMWSKGDSGTGMNWQDALAWVQRKNAEKFLGQGDWRLPSVKELQSIADYTRSPDTSHSPAIDPLFNCTTITNEGGQADFPYYWSATTHAGLLGGGLAACKCSRGWAAPRTRRHWARSRPGTQSSRTARCEPGTDRRGRLPFRGRSWRWRSAQRPQDRRSCHVSTWPRPARRRHPHLQLRPARTRWTGLSRRSRTSRSGVSVERRSNLF